MKSNRTLGLGLLIVFFFAIKTGISQDIHYSQFYNSPTNVNPALTGIFNGDKRLSGSFRDQARSTRVPWTTVSLAYDQKFFTDNSEKGFWSAGILFNYDKDGDSQMSLNNLNLKGSYTRILNETNLLTGGLMLGYASRGFDETNLRWDSQYRSGEFDPAAPNGENFDATRINMFESALGLNYRWQKTSRTKVDVGAGLYHLIKPKVNFYEAETQSLPRRFDVNGVASLELIDKFDLQLQAMAQFQSSYREYIIGALGKLYLNDKRGKETEVHFGLGYRTSGFLYPTLALKYKNIYVSGSWDFDLNSSLGNLGGPEVHVQYIMTSVKPLKKFKVCPIF